MKPTMGTCSGSQLPHELGLKFLLAILCVLVTGCSSLGPIQADSSPRVSAKLESPKMCMALSGGGLRSAATSVGALQAINASVGLSSIDVISSTSGGGWAQYWLHAQLAQGRTIDQVLGENYAEDTPDIKRLDGSSFMDLIGKIGMFTGAQSTYKALIINAFASSPNHWPNEPSIRDMQINVEDKGAPVPVFVLSTFARCGRDQPELATFGKEGLPVSARLKEFLPIDDYMIEVNPIEWGSEKFGYGSVFPFALNNPTGWATLASAVTDSPGYRRCNLVRLFGLSIGATVTTPRHTTVGSFTGDEEIFVADGGFVDNLAVKVLVNMRCKSILIVDAEQDHGFVFEGYQRVRNDLRQQGLNFNVPAIEAWLASPEGTACQVNEGSCFVTRAASNTIVRNPLMKGCVTSSDSCDGGSQNLVKVQYLKLSLDPQRALSGELSGQLGAYFTGLTSQPECRDLASGSPDHCKFPHTPTFVTNYSEDQFRAHRLLGKDLVRMHFDASWFEGSHPAPSREQ